MRRFWSLVAVLLCVLVLNTGCSTQPERPSNGPAQPRMPPMGWNSWNSGVALTAANIKAVIDAMVSSGMRDAGYRYVNLDAGWAAPRRTAAGELQADPIRFPDGMADLAKYAHDRGMLLGLYASPFNEGCSAQPALAAAGHETRDAKDYADWGIDMLKYDWCRNEADHQHHVQVFTAMRDALRASGRRIVYSINPNSSDDQTAGIRYDWSDIADMARATNDLVPVWHDQLPRLGPLDPFAGHVYLGVPDEFAAAAKALVPSKQGYWVDADMLVAGIGWDQWVAGHLNSVRNQLTVGAPPDAVRQFSAAADDQLLHAVTDHQPNLTTDEQRAHLSLWSMLSAPLIAGNDVRAMSKDTQELLTNRDVIAVDQDSLTAPMHPLAIDPRVLLKWLSDGAMAVALVNGSDKPVTMATTAAAAGLPAVHCYTVRDTWTHQDRSSTGAIDGGIVPPHAVTLLRVTPRCP
ncbi:glycoside hydrolase family 27 protein [Mycolicibacterium aubagnense]|uniref:Alpha-galactosidase n=1 Tax=Mycolicibacterium aubagnense TaxID=319707 RepID=A0ABM7IHX1_9MYCO|nr:glycoside hydrolase family 27 protein [Mycolicibacterium aubagnense]TLH68161.1 glycoside hydrolase family 27 protein [Mycolicibacterium aubagnense]WGI32140.1 glycoside hydrolase family 27 protein [Mycolicibacterium aubagnense]BBX86325.1 alpha-galactosidase [Mycolicibacterium aubagnense]